MNCPICGKKVSLMGSFPVNVGHGSIERIDANCMKQLGIGKMNLIAQETIKKMPSSELKSIIDNGQTLKEHQKNSKKSMTSVFSDFAENGRGYGSLFISDSKKQMMNVVSMIESKYDVYDFDNLMSYSRDVKAKTTTTSKKSHGITRGVVGAVIAGPVGAIIGVGTAGSNGVSKEDVESVDFFIKTKDGNHFTVSLTGNDIDKANDLDVALDTIIMSNKQTDQVPVGNIKNQEDLENLNNLKKLVDAGILTEEEFTAKKKQILDI